MGRKKGTRKTGGRKKGTPNRVTNDVRQWLNELINNNRQQVERDLRALKPKERLQILEKYMQYTIPKMQSVQTKIDFNSLSDKQLDNFIREITKDI